MSNVTESTLLPAVVVPHEVIFAEPNDMDSAWQQMNGPLRAATEKAVNQLNGLGKSYVNTLWSLGKHLRMIRDNEERFGDNALSLVERYVGSVNRGMMQKAIALNTWVTEDELHAMVNLRTINTNKPLTWQHYEKLLTVKDPEVRTTLAKETVANEWGIEELQKAVLKSRGLTSAQKHAGGRKVAVPATPTAKCDHYLKFMNFIIRNAEAIYEEKQEGFEALANSIPSDKITPDLIEKFAVMIETTRTVEDFCRRIRHTFDEGRENIRERMNTQAENQGTKEADAIVTKKPPEVAVVKAKRGRPRKVVATN